MPAVEARRPEFGFPESASKTGCISNPGTEGSGEDRQIQRAGLASQSHQNYELQVQEETSITKKNTVEND